MSENQVQFLLRPGTQDEGVVKEVLQDNMYGLRKPIPKGKNIIDIGANIGAFAVACLARGADSIVCFEPDNQCYEFLTHNTNQWREFCTLHNAAIWRRDEPVVYCCQQEKTACGYVLPQRLQKIRSLSAPSTDLDSVIESVFDVNDGRVALLKIDAEGAEYPILYTSQLLDKVGEIVGETHSMVPAGSWTTNMEAYGFSDEECSISGVVRFLESHGFTVVTKKESRDNSVNHLFWAHRPSTPDRLCQP